VFVWRGVVATAFAVARLLASILCGGVVQAGPADTANFLLFGGTDLWRYGDFLYGGALWSPGGLNNDGVALKLLLNGGTYNYKSGDLNRGADGDMFSAAAMPGWRFSRGGLSVGFFAGPVAQDYRLSPNDPGSRLHGFYAGGQFTGEVWYQPAPNLMAAMSGSIISIGPTGSLRGALGVRAFNIVFVGPEAAAFWCGDFQQFQFGLHLTGWRWKALEWSAGGGWSTDSDRRSGPYLRLGVSTRY
jgi:Cellulose biosynthesis protein BcsS